MLNNKKALLLPIFIIISSFLWTQFLWAYGIPLQNEVPSKPEETQKNLPLNIQEKVPKEFCKISKITQILTKNNPEDSSPETIEKKLFPTVKERTGEVLRVAFLVNPDPQIPPQFYPGCDVFDTLGRVQEKVGTIDGESYKVTYKEYDSLGRPLRWTEKQGDAKIEHSQVIYNEIGQITSEYIKVKVSQGSGIFESSSETLTHYEYSYDIYGNRETTLEDEIYSKTSSNPIGKIVKAIVSVVTIAVTWGMATPFVAAVMAVENMVFNVLSGMDFKDALIGAAISFAATCIGMQFGELISGTSVAAGGVTGVAGFLKDGGMTVLFEMLSLADSLMVDDQGRGMFEQIFGKWGSVVFQAISIGAGLMNGGGGINGPPYQLYAGIGKLLISAALTAAGDSIHPYLRQFISAFSNSFFNSWAEGMTIRYQMETSLGHEIQGHITVTKQYDETGERLLTYTAETESGQYVFNAGMQIMSYTDQTGTTWYNRDGSPVVFTMQSITETVYDEMGMPIYSKLESGDIIAYDSKGFFAGYIQEGTEIYWKDGEMYSSKDFDGYTNHYNSYGEKQYTIIDGYTPIERNGEVIGQYKNTDTEGNSYVYRDADGNFVNKITITDSGVIANDGIIQQIFDTSNHFQGIAPTNASISWNDDGSFKESFIENDGYTEYFGKDGELKGRILDGYTAIRNGDKIEGQYKNTDQTGNTYIYRDASGRFVSKIIITEDGGVLRNDGTWTTYFNDSNTKVWTKYNQEYSNQYFYDAKGKTIIGAMYTMVTDSGLVQGKIYHNLVDNEYTFYDAQGNQLLPTINPGELKEKVLNFGADTLNRIKTSLYAEMQENIIAASRKQITYLADGTAVIDLSKAEINDDPILEYIKLGLSIFDPTGGALGAMLSDFTDYDTELNQNIISEVLHKGRGFYILEEGLTGTKEEFGLQLKEMFKDNPLLKVDQITDFGPMLHVRIGMSMGPTHKMSGLAYADIIEKPLTNLTGQEKAQHREIMDYIYNNRPDLWNKYFKGFHIVNSWQEGENGEPYIWNYGGIKGLRQDVGKTIMVHGINNDEATSLSFAGFGYSMYQRQLEVMNDADVIGYAWDSVGKLRPIPLQADFWEDVADANVEGEALANLIMEIKQEYPDQPINLISHSLGARVILKALETIETLDPIGYKDYVDDICFVDPAIDNTALSKGGEFYGVVGSFDSLAVYFSNTDEILKYPYRWYKCLGFDFGTRAMGYTGPVGVYDDTIIHKVNTTPGYSDLGIHGIIRDHSSATSGIWDETIEIQRDIWNRIK